MSQFILLVAYFRKRACDEPVTDGDLEFEQVGTTLILAWLGGH
jgi:hypothetical protein